MISNSIPYLFLLFLFFSHVSDDDISQWRGPNRDGKYPGKNLLTEWPASGPDLVWSYEGLGEGHGTVGIGKDGIFICGMPDSTGFLYAFDFDGKLRWIKEYGPEWYKNYTGSRSTPTVVGNHVYFESGQGVVYCYNGDSGDLVWSVDLLNKFDAHNIQWGMAESLLVDGNKIYCTPGGKKHNVVALDRFSGKTIWTSPGNQQPAAYCSPILINHNGTRLIVTMTAESIIGLDANTGESYWAIEQLQRHKIHANTPVYHDGKIVCASSSDLTDIDGTVQISLSENGKSAAVTWRNNEITNLMGGIILKNGYIFGAKYRRSDWYCVDWNSGEIKYISNSLNGGVIIYADGHFYCYTERGEMALVIADENEFKIVSKFNVPLGTMQYWAHPVIENRRLYIRHGNALMVYDVGA